MNFNRKGDVSLASSFGEKDGDPRKWCREDTSWDPGTCGHGRSWGNSPPPELWTPLSLSFPTPTPPLTLFCEKPKEKGQENESVSYSPTSLRLHIAGHDKPPPSLLVGMDLSSTVWEGKVLSLPMNPTGWGSGVCLLVGSLWHRQKWPGSALLPSSATAGRKGGRQVDFASLLSEFKECWGSWGSTTIGIAWSPDGQVTWETEPYYIERPEALCECLSLGSEWVRWLFSQKRNLSLFYQRTD